ncbi:MAG: cobalt-precorrin-4/precorrin-4 C(11)-methyltransferase [Caldimicrobium sp.]|nr:cobalt-precorrin-4/precorrin-4 C(11)-methyltransferase [Caldimicrobium sp.]MCX7874315.1 cobalt-precorrin-4/precorrin-4 C(11)-methyltransferase [Caldimicrobium sp.]MDW8094921.1 cobalt-precorrin-4/precorrin-4 C(11)-methyltransferase [Caldimicrobium sp.]
MEKVYFIGMGPGDPELLTLKAVKILKEAHCIIYPGSLISSEMLRYLREINSDALYWDAFGRSLEEILERILDSYSQGERVVRVVSGDPSLYSSVMEHIELLRERGIPYEIIPGISSALLASSRLGIELTYPDFSHSVIFTRFKGKTGGAEEEEILKFAQTKSTLVFFLSSGLGKRLEDTLLKALPSDTPTAILYRLSQPEEKILLCPLSQLASTIERENISKSALIIVGEVLRLIENNYFKRSILYGKK